MKIYRVPAVFGAVLLCAFAAAAEAGDQFACRTCSAVAKQTSASTGNDNGNVSDSSGSRNSGRVFGVFQTRSRSDMRSSWYHTHPKWSAGRKATGAAYR